MKFHLGLGQLDPYLYITEARDFEAVLADFKSQYPDGYSPDLEGLEDLRNLAKTTAKANGLLLTTGEYLENRFFAHIRKDGFECTRVSRLSETHAALSCLIEHAQQHTVTVLTASDDFTPFPDWLQIVKKEWSHMFDLDPSQYQGDWERDFVADYENDFSPSQAVQALIDNK